MNVAWHAVENNSDDEKDFKWESNEANNDLF